MNTELYIENYRLDISKEISALLTFSIDDIKDFSARSTTWSKTIVLPGTANNNKLFGHIFQIGQANEYVDASNVGYNFNASKSADCIIFQDHIQSFKGVLRLMQINIIQGKIEYEVSVFGKLAGLNVALSNGFLDQLDFSAYDHIFDGDAIVASWDNSPGTGVYYPLIDYGTYSTDKHNWDIRTFRPALYVREYIDKMFSVAGFRWSSQLFQTLRFKKLIIPHNQKRMNILSDSLVSASINSNKDINLPILPTTGTTVAAAFDTVLGSGLSANVGKTIFTYESSLSANVNFDFRFEGLMDAIFGVPILKIQIWKNGSELVYESPHLGLGSNPFTLIGNENIPLASGDTIEFKYFGRNVDVEITTATFEAKSTTAITIPISTGDPVRINDYIPKNVRQIDFLVSIVKLFNLYVYEDKFDTSLIYLTPYIDYYSPDTTASVDWTYKLNRDKVIKVKPMSELNAKIYNFKFKPDNDYYNELYKKRYGQGYGDYVFDSRFEFAEQQKEFEIIFSATPLVGYVGEDKVYATIIKRTGPDTAPVEENVDSNIRILQTKKITGVETWAIVDGETESWFLNKYGYAGHFNDPDVPVDDLNFGALRELFFILVSGSLSATQFNVFWSGYMAEITDKDSKLLTAYFYLNPKDILDIDFSRYVYIDGVAFRINSIKDYNASRPTDCLVELIKVNHTTYSAAGSGDSPPVGNYLLWDNNEIMDWSDGADDHLLYQGDETAPEPLPPEPSESIFITNNSLDVSVMLFRVDGVDVPGSYAAPGEVTGHAMTLPLPTADVFVEWSSSIGGQSIYLIDTNGVELPCENIGAGDPTPFFTWNIVDMTGPNQLTLVLQDGSCPP